MKTDALDNLLACLPNGIAADSKAELQDLKDTNAQMRELLEAAIARVQLEHREGNPILSAWLKDARATLKSHE